MSRATPKPAAPKRATPDRATREMRDMVCAANVDLFTRGLAKFTFGNASAVDRERVAPRHQAGRAQFERDAFGRLGGVDGVERGAHCDRRTLVLRL